MLAPSLVILVTFVLYPLGKAIGLGQQRCDVQGDNCRSNGWDQYWDVVPQRRVPARPARHHQVRADHGAARSGARRRTGGARRQVAARVGLFRAVFSSTVATSVAVASLMWLFLLQPEIGALSNVEWISDLFPVVKNPGLLRDPGTALASVAMSSVWASLGFTFILVTASLQGIPQDLHEAAAIDGAGGIARFWSVTLPLLGPTLLFVVIVLTTRAFQAYGEIDLLTAGGPRPEDSTTTITYLTYGQESIIINNDGLQAAVAVLLFVVLLVLSLLQLRGIGKRVHYGRLRTSTSSRRAAGACVGRYLLLAVRVGAGVVPRVHDGDRRPQAGQRGAPEPARTGPVHARRILRRVDGGPPRPVPPQLVRRRVGHHHRPGRDVAARRRTRSR